MAAAYGRRLLAQSPLSGAPGRHAGSHGPVAPGMSGLFRGQRPQSWTFLAFPATASHGLDGGLLAGAPRVSLSSHNLSQRFRPLATSATVTSSEVESDYESQPRSRPRSTGSSARIGGRRSWSRHNDDGDGAPEREERGQRRSASRDASSSGATWRQEEQRRGEQDESGRRPGGRVLRPLQHRERREQQRERRREWREEGDGEREERRRSQEGASDGRNGQGPMARFGSIGGRAALRATRPEGDSPTAEQRVERASRQAASSPAPPSDRPAQRSAQRAPTAAGATAAAVPAAAAVAVAAAAAATKGGSGGNAARPEGQSEQQLQQPPQPPPQKKQQQQAPQSGAAAQAGELVAPPEGVYPTFVPRNPGIQDGDWNARDADMVTRAQRDSVVVAAPPAKVDPKGAVLLGMDLASLEALAERYGQPRFRAKQLREAVLQGAHSMEDISTIPKEWRAQLAADGVRTGRSLLHHSVGDEDGTRKFLLQLHDGRIIETVGIPTPGRLTVCVSSQVGCPMRCTFCATGKGGFARNLAPHEIVDQVLTVQEQFGRRVSNVVFMGMGEPLLNLPAVLRAYQGLNKDIGIGGASITVSTVGVPNAIARLAAADTKTTLAVSLHAPNQALRESIIPSAKAYPLEALMEDCERYFKRTGRRVTFEYTLLAGVNDELTHAEELTSLLRRHDMMSHVNLIRWNPVDGSTFQRPSRNRVFAFQRAVEAAGLACTVRETRGLEAAAACGQLRNQFQKQPLPQFEVPR